MILKSPNQVKCANHFSFTLQGTWYTFKVSLAAVSSIIRGFQNVRNVLLDELVILLNIEQ